jgi:hypothetical protein
MRQLNSKLANECHCVFVKTEVSPQTWRGALQMGKYIKDYSGAPLDKHGHGQRVGCHWCRQCTR